MCSERVYSQHRREKAPFSQLRTSQERDPERSLDLSPDRGVLSKGGGSREHVHSGIPVHKSVPRGFPEIEVLALKRSQGNERKDPCTQTKHSRENWGRAGLSGKDHLFRFDWNPWDLAILGSMLLTNRMPMFYFPYCYIKTMWPKAIGKKGVYFIYTSRSLSFLKEIRAGTWRPECMLFCASLPSTKGLFTAKEVWQEPERLLVLSLNASLPAYAQIAFWSMQKHLSRNGAAHSGLCHLSYYTHTHIIYYICIYVCVCI